MIVKVVINEIYFYRDIGDLRRESKMGPKSDGSDSGESSRAESAEPPLSTEDILGAVEEAYPNSLTIDDMARLDFYISNFTNKS